MLHCKFSGDYNSERIFKIGQYLTKLSVEPLGSLFWPTLYIEDRPIDRPTSHLAHIGEISNGHISATGFSDPLHVWFYGGVFGVGGSNGANSSLTKFNRCVGENNARGVIRLVTI